MGGLQGTNETLEAVKQILASLFPHHINTLEPRWYTHTEGPCAGGLN